MTPPHLEPLPITSLKQDPAWKHVQMFKHGDRVQLKCIYCGKVFRGGGIHRIKEHLANQKGNAATCLHVPPNVRDLMKESLHAVVTKRRKKEKIVDEITNFNVITSEVDPFDNECDANTGVQFVGAPNTLEASPNFLPNREGTSSATGDRRKRVKEKSSVNVDDLAINTNGLGAKQANIHLHMAIGRFLFDVGAPLDAVNSVYFKPMVDAIISVGAESVLPSQDDIRGWILKNSVEEVKIDVHKLAAAWGKIGCSVLVNQQKTETKILLNFLVHCPEGTIFLKSVDASGFLSSPDALYELLNQVVEEVGSKNVLQVITNNEELCMVAARRLADTFPTLYWTPCAVCCLDMILRDFANLDWINAIMEQARSITRFVYNHSAVLNMVRRYTLGFDIVEPAVTCSATNFTTLKRLVDVKHYLQSMVTSQEWVDCQYSKTPCGLKMLDIASDHSFWSSCVLITRLTNPLLRVLRIVVSKKHPAMGYVYAAMYRAKETIKRELIKRENYLIYWNIIDHWWQRQWQHPLYAAGFYLNPKFFYSFEGELPNEILSGMFDCIERLVPDMIVQDKIVKEMNTYKNAIQDLGRKMVIRARETLLPAEWWSTYGGSCPNLARLAIRVLSQSCSSHGLNLNHIAFEQLHDVRNCLEHQRRRDLIFVQCNMRLKQIGSEDKKHESVDLLSIDAISVVEDWIREKDVCLQNYSTSDWMALDLSAVSTMMPGSPVDDIDELGAGFDDYEIFKRVKDDD